MLILDSSKHTLLSNRASIQGPEAAELSTAATSNSGSSQFANQKFDKDDLDDFLAAEEPEADVSGGSSAKYKEDELADSLDTDWSLGVVGSFSPSASKSDANETSEVPAELGYTQEFGSWTEIFKWLCAKSTSSSGLVALPGQTM